MVPVAIAQRPSLDGESRGQFDDVLPVYAAKARLALLTMEAVQKSVEAPLALPTDVTSLSVGPDSVIRSNSPEKIRRVNLDVPQYAFAENNVLADETLQQELELFNNCDSLTGNKVDELRYLFLSSQVELVSDISAIQTAEYKGESDFVSVGIVKADGEKCDRCWNYSTQVGKFADDPTICERCNAALKGEF